MAVIKGSNIFDVLQGTDGNDDIYAYGGADTIWAGAGNDYIEPGAGDDTIYGGDGNDTISYLDYMPEDDMGNLAIPPDKLNFKPGVHVDLAAGEATMWVTYYNPETDGWAGPFIETPGWHAFWWDQHETDHFYSIENAAGSNYDDVLSGNDDPNWLYGYGGADQLRVRGGADHLLGLDGDDRLDGGSGADALDGGDGVDTADYGTALSAVNVSLETGKGYWGDSAGDTLYDIENLNGSFFDDDLVGNGKANHLDGANGDDYLKGGGGADTLDGGADSDTAAYGDSSSGVAVLLNNLDKGVGSGGDAEGDTLFSIEDLTGSYYDDTFIGNDDANVLEGLGGNDTLKGFGGADTLIGGHGIDTMYGGPGADHFVWEEIADTGITLATMDTVRDFDPAQLDKIDVHSIDADATVGGHQAFTFIDDASTQVTAPGQINFVHMNGDTYIVLNTNADPAADAIIQVSGIHAVEAGWFVL